MAAGHAFAREACNSCHIVEAEQRSPRLLSVGPAFRDIANTPGVTAIALRAFLTSSHPRMPNLILTPKETADVIAYILSLRDRRSSNGYDRPISGRCDRSCAGGAMPTGGRSW